jgi:formate-dependent nitrite reductase membrane component NrfD
VPIFALYDPASPEFLADCANLQLIVLASALLLFLAHVLQGSYGQVAARLSVKRLIREDLNMPFVWGTLVGGILVPLALVLSGDASDSELQLVLLATAGILTLAGNWLSKYAIIKAGMYAALL